MPKAGGILYKLNLIVRLARRGAWYGVWRFSCVLLYGLMHRKCKKCGTVKGFNSHILCYSCQYRNLMTALYADEDGEEAK